MSDDVKEDLSDYSQIFQENYDRIPKEVEQLEKFFKDVNEWLYLPMPKEHFNEDLPNLLWQYHEKAQPEFMKFQTKLSGITKAIYLVVKDVNEITQTGTKAYQDSDYLDKKLDPTQGQRQVINVETASPSIFHNPFKKKKETNLPKSLEDAWMKSENWKEEVLNIPKIYRKYVLWHHYGVRCQQEFDGYGMEDYRDNEASYLNTYVEPLISNIVTRALDIQSEQQTDKLERIYTNTQQSQKEIETARIMAGQGGEESNPKG